MKRVILLVSMLVVVAAPAGAQTYVSFGGGGSLPVLPSSFRDLWNPGWNVGATLDAQITDWLVFHPVLIYTEFGLDGDALLADFGLPGDGAVVDGGKFKSFYLGATLKYALGGAGRLTPYVYGGAGYFHATIESVRVRSGSLGNVSFEDFDDALGVSGGAGVDVFLTDEVGGFVETGLVYGFTAGDGHAYVPVMIGVRLRSTR